MLTVIGLLAAFLLPISLGTLLACILTRFIPKLRTSMYVKGFGDAIASWITVALFLLFLFPEIDLNLADIGFKSTISPVEVGLASLLAFVSLSYFAVMTKLSIFKICHPL